MSRLAGVTPKLSCTALIVEVPVLVKVTVYEVLSPRLIEVGPDRVTVPCGAAPLMTVTVTLAVALPAVPVAVRV